MANPTISREPHWLNKSRMATSLGITTQAFDKWGVQPVAKIGRDVFYDVRSVLDNRLKHQVTKDQPVDDNGDPIDPLIEYKQAQQKLRLTTEQADAQEMRNKVKAKKLVPVDFCLFALSRLSAKLGSTLDTVHLKVKRKCPDIEVRHLEAIQREVAVTRNDAIGLADLLPELLDEFVDTLDEGAG
ncbi:DNA-packaging protein [Pseudomonas fluorescens]|uniref:terminase small subunit n=1 Tax=Pseudomonas TaxID=286 RepID=UPI00070985DB|nr:MULTISPECIES: terminase small subunit [Pseudomonas]OOQ44258.1 DNA-packaging protein [Pseudomonas fluorescens]